MPLNIAIVGAGIGGLAAAALLADQGHSLTVFDRFDAPRPVGSGLVIQPVGQAVLDRIGAGDMARQKGNAINRMLGHEADHGRRVLDVWYDRSAGVNHGLAIHRAALFDAILQAALTRNSLTIVPAAAIAGVTDATNDARRLILADGTRTDPFDLVIDAAGASSPLSPLVSRTLSYGAIWGTVDWPETDLPHDQLSQQYRRADRMIGALPIGTMPGETVPKAAVFWSMPADSHAAWTARGLDAWKDEAIALWPAIAPFLEQITDTGQMTMARYSHGTLRRPFGDRIAHIGDAAHRASPQLGQGANMALLDALALAEALRLHPLQAALPAYARARRWHVAIYQAMSWAFTPQYQSDSRILPLLRDRVLFPVSMIPPVPRLLTALVRGSMINPLGRLGSL